MYATKYFSHLHKAFLLTRRDLSKQISFNKLKFPTFKPSQRENYRTKSTMILVLLTMTQGSKRVSI